MTWATPEAPAATRGTERWCRYADPVVQGKAVPLVAVGCLIALLAGLAFLGRGQPQGHGVPLAPAASLTIEEFMTGLACIESSGRYSAVNAESGAIGKYQIMPRNWRVWAGRFLGDSGAEPSPDNQELVARTRIERLRARLGDWRRVAYWWLTGRTIRDEARWTDKALGYVDSVMDVARREATPALAWAVPERCRPVPPDSSLPA